MTDWTKRIDELANERQAALVAMLVLEFKRLAREVKPDNPRAAVRAHAGRLTAILGAHKQTTAAAFGWLTLAMLAPRKDEVKAGEPPTPAAEPTRAERISRVLVEMARTVGLGAIAKRIAEILGRNRLLISHIEVALLSNPNAEPRTIVAQLVQDQRIAATIAFAQAEATNTAPDLVAIEQQLTSDARATRSVATAPASSPPSGGGKPPPPPPPPRGGPAPRRSRFSILVEQIVRQEAPIRARRIAATSGQVIARILAQAAREGWGEERASKELVAVLGGEVTRFRAQVIARTELGSAQNGASYALALDRAADGALIDKTWRTSGDGRESEGGRTRDTHADAEGQTVPLNEAFTVGGAKLQYPHDPRGPLKEIVNCRCGLVFRTRSGRGG